MEKARISAVVLAKNEQARIGTCLQSLSWCDERIVIDDNSTDKTISIAKKYGATVYTRSLDSDFAAQRNFALTKAKNEWVLFIDADEQVPSALAKEIAFAMQTTKDGFYLKRHDTLWGKTLTHGEQSAAFLRLARKGKGKWVGKVHETWKIQKNTHLLQHPLLHFPHQTLAAFLEEINVYSTIRAKELYQKGETANWLSILFHTKGKFIQDYFIRLGFLDGIEGFIVALLMSFHAFLVRGKLWQLTNK